MKQKILYILTKSDIGGAQKYVRDLSENLNKNSFETKIIYGGKDLKWLSNKVYPWALFFNDFLAIFEIKKMLEKERPDLIHLNNSKGGFLGTLGAALYNKRASKKATVIFTAHGWVFNPTNAVPLLIRWFYVVLHKFSALFEDKIICVSEHDYALAKKYKIAPKEKLVTIHNGINPEIKFLTKDEARKEIANKISKSKVQRPNFNYPWVGSIGRLVKEKNYETMIRAATLIPKVYFFIIGKGPEFKKCQKLIIADQLEKRFFLIETSGNDAQYLKAFDIFVMSSVKEGLPYILLEAMTAGLPSVVTEAGGLPEIIKNHENGLMVTQKNPKQLGQAISGLLANRQIAEELGKSARTAVAEHFNVKKMIEKTENTYNALLK